jgi:hypothetical protein
MEKQGVVAAAPHSEAINKDCSSSIEKKPVPFIA